MAKDKRPSFQFYPGDWMKDPDLRRCSHNARGVWIDMLCLMFECSDRGVLASQDVPWTDREVAGAIGGDPADAIAGIGELVAKGVVRRRADGALYSSRLVADERLRQARSKAGAKGGRPKNKRLRPFFKQTESKPKANRKQNLTPSSSSSSSPSGRDPPTPLGVGSSPEAWGEFVRRVAAAPLRDSAEFIEIWCEWCGHRAEIRKRLTERAAKMQLRRLEAMGHDRAIAAIRHSIAQGWTGIYEPNADRRASSNGQAYVRDSSRNWDAGNIRAPGFQRTSAETERPAMDAEQGP